MTGKFRFSVLLAVLILIGCTRRTLVISVQDASGIRSLSVEQIGDPVFPYGPTACEATLYRGKKILRKESFEMKNDGKNAAAENFSVVWKSDGADLIIYAEEEEEKTISLR